MTTIVPPPAPLPPALSGGARTGIRVALVAVATLTVACTAISLAVLAFGVSAFRAITDTKQLPLTVRYVSIDTGEVPVLVRVTTDAAARGPRVDLRMLTSVREDTRPLIVANDADRTRVMLGSAGVSYLRWNRLGEVTVVLPPGSARGVSVTARSNDGDVKVTDLR
jgi:hypothetical protein